MKLLYRLAINIFGYGSALNQFTLQCLESQSEERNMLVAEKLCSLVKNMVDIQLY